MRGRGDGSTSSPLACPELVEGSTSTLILPPAFAEAASRRQASKGEDNIEEISNIFGWDFFGLGLQLQI